MGTDACFKVSSVAIVTLTELRRLLVVELSLCLLKRVQFLTLLLLKSFKVSNICGITSLQILRSLLKSLTVLTLDIFA